MRQQGKWTAIVATLLLAACGPDGLAANPPPPAEQNPSALSGENILYADGQRLDLFVPAKDVRRTALVFIHGGGFTGGDKGDLAGHARLLSDGGFITASINYRLSPASPAPAAQNNVAAALRWLRQGGGGRGLAVDRVILIGYSAGGTLAMMAALDHPNEAAAVISAAGPTDLAELARTTGNTQLKQDIADYTRGIGAAAASPVSRPLNNTPPMFLIHGDADQLVPISQSVAMAQRLNAAGANVLLKAVPGVGHEVLLPGPKFAEIMRDIARYAVAVDAQ